MGLFSENPGTHISIFYLSAISRDIDLKLIQDTYRVVINSTKQIDQTGMWGGGGEEVAISDIKPK